MLRGAESESSCPNYWDHFCKAVLMLVFTLSCRQAALGQRLSVQSMSNPQVCLRWQGLAIHSDTHNSSQSPSVLLVLQAATSDEGGVAAGFAVLDSPCLVE